MFHLQRFHMNLMLLWLNADVLICMKELSHTEFPNKIQICCTQLQITMFNFLLQHSMRIKVYKEEYIRIRFFFKSKFLIPVGTEMDSLNT